MFLLHNDRKLHNRTLEKHTRDALGKGIKKHSSLQMEDFVVFYIRYMQIRREKELQHFIHLGTHAIGFEVMTECIAFLDEGTRLP